MHELTGWKEALPFTELNNRVQAALSPGLLQLWLAHSLPRRGSRGGGVQGDFKAPVAASLTSWTEGQQEAEAPLEPQPVLGSTSQRAPSDKGKFANPRPKLQRHWGRAQGKHMYFPVVKTAISCSN